MRVFNNYSFNLKDKVKFKDTFEFIATFMKANRLEYEQLLFDFSDVYAPIEHKDEQKENPNLATAEYKKEEDTRMYNVCKKYDPLKEYYYNVHSRTSKPTLWDQHITNLPFNSSTCATAPVSRFNHDSNIYKTYSKGELISCLNEVCSKIPRPYNFSYTSIIFDRINWFENINKHLTINDSTSGWRNRDFQSNCILYCKKYDTGTKSNPVSARIEVTNPNDKNSILDDSEVVSKLTSYFGEPSKEMICVFDDDEFEMLDTANIEIKDMIYNQFKSLILPGGLTYEDFGYTEDAPVSSKKLIPRKSFFKVFKGMGYEAAFCSPIFTRKEKYNYCSQISFNLSGTRLQTSLTMQGHNFKLYFINGKYVCNEEMLLSSMEDTKYLMTLLLDTYVEKLFELYGKTPDWFEHTTRYWGANVLSLDCINRECLRKTWQM